MKQKWEHIIQPSDCPGSEVLRQYHLGLLLANQRFAVEDHLAHCEMCSDELEGLALLDDASRLPIIENELRTQLKFKIFKNRVRTMPFNYRLAAVASILLLLSVSVWMYFKPSPMKTMEVAVVEKPAKAAAPISAKATPEKTTTDGRIVSEPKPNQPMVEKEETQPKVVAAREGLVSDDELRMNAKESPISEDKADQMVAPSALSAISVSNAAITESAAAPTKGTRTVAGLVTDEMGQPLPGVTVVTEGNMGRGQITDANGRYRIAIHANDTVLRYQFVGMNTKEVKVTGQTEVDVKLQESAMALNEVVVMSTSLTGRLAGISVSKKRARRNSEATVHNAQFTTLRDTAEYWIRTHEMEKSLDALDRLKSASTESQGKAIAEIRALVQDEKFDKALKKLKGMK